MADSRNDLDVQGIMAKLAAVRGTLTSSDQVSVDTSNLSGNLASLMEGANVQDLANLVDTLTISSEDTGLTQADVDARISALVAAWALAASTSSQVPVSKLEETPPSVFLSRDMPSSTDLSNSLAAHSSTGILWIVGRDQNSGSNRREVTINAFSSNHTDTQGTPIATNPVASTRYILRAGTVLSYTDGNFQVLFELNRTLDLPTWVTDPNVQIPVSKIPLNEIPSAELPENIRALARDTTNEGDVVRFGSNVHLDPSNVTESSVTGEFDTFNVTFNDTNSAPVLGSQRIGRTQELTPGLLEIEWTVILLGAQRIPPAITQLNVRLQRSDQSDDQATLVAIPVSSIDVGTRSVVRVPITSSGTYSLRLEYMYSTLPENSEVRNFSDVRYTHTVKGSLHDAIVGLIGRNSGSSTPIDTSRLWTSQKARSDGEQKLTLLIEKSYDTQQPLDYQWYTLQGTTFSTIGAPSTGTQAQITAPSNATHIGLPGDIVSSHPARLGSLTLDVVGSQDGYFLYAVTGGSTYDTGPYIEVGVQELQVVADVEIIKGQIQATNEKIREILAKISEIDNIVGLATRSESDTITYTYNDTVPDTGEAFTVEESPQVFTPTAFANPPADEDIEGQIIFGNFRPNNRRGVLGSITTTPFGGVGSQHPVLQYENEEIQVGTFVAPVAARTVSDSFINDVGALVEAEYKRDPYHQHPETAFTDSIHLGAPGQAETGSSGNTYIWNPTPQDPYTINLRFHDEANFTPEVDGIVGQYVLSNANADGPFNRYTLWATQGRDYNSDPHWQIDAIYRAATHTIDLEITLFHAIGLTEYALYIRSDVTLSKTIPAQAARVDYTPIGHFPGGNQPLPMAFGLVRKDDSTVEVIYDINGTFGVHDTGLTTTGVGLRIFHSQWISGFDFQRAEAYSSGVPDFEITGFDQDVTFGSEVDTFEERKNVVTYLVKQAIRNLGDQWLGARTPENHHHVTLDWDARFRVLNEQGLPFYIEPGGGTSGAATIGFQQIGTDSIVTIETANLWWGTGVQIPDDEVFFANFGSTTSTGNDDLQYEVVRRQDLINLTPVVAGNPRVTSDDRLNIYESNRFVNIDVGRSASNEILVTSSTTLLFHPLSLWRLIVTGQDGRGIESITANDDLTSATVLYSDQTMDTIPLPRGERGPGVDRITNTAGSNVATVRYEDGRENPLPLPIFEPSQGQINTAVATSAAVNPYSYNIKYAFNNDYQVAREFESGVPHGLANKTNVLTVDSGSPGITATKDYSLVLVDEEVPAGINPTIPFITSWEGDLQLDANTPTASTSFLEIESKFTHFSEEAGREFSDKTVYRIRVFGNDVRSISMSSFNSTVTLSEGQYKKSG